MFVFVILQSLFTTSRADHFQISHAQAKLNIQLKADSYRIEKALLKLKSFK